MPQKVTFISLLKDVLTDGGAKRSEGILFLTEKEIQKVDGTGVFGQYRNVLYDYENRFPHHILIFADTKRFSFISL